MITSVHANVHMINKGKNRHLKIHRNVQINNVADLLNRIHLQ